MVPLVIGAFVIGGVGGYGYTVTIARSRAASAESRARKLEDEAKAKARETLLEAKAEAIKMADSAKQDEKEVRQRLAQTEQQLLDRQGTLDRKLEELDRRQEGLRQEQDELGKLKDELRAIRTKQQANLEKLAKLTSDQAREKLLQITERDVKADLLAVTAKLQQEAKETAEDQAREILTTAMERIASEQTTERTVTTVPIAGDELKGRVIGKEGRNIQALERATGVDIIIDETPGAIVLSSFDPIRRQVARVALEKLLADGRIHPARIEEIVAKAQAEIEKEVKEAGEQAIKEAGVVGIPAELVPVLGQLKFRTSYSQNVLKHSVEMAHLAGMIATEVGADVRISKTAALLHDLGKAMTHEIDGGHHHISAMMCEKAGIEPAICHAVEAHHDDVEATTPEALIVRVVDALSAGRPGARGDTFENYVKRMTELENLANTFPGVAKTYAVSAGREIRVFVIPEEIDDLSALKLSRDIATKVEATLRYPGVIKVSVIRETRAIEYAK